MNRDELAAEREASVARHEGETHRRVVRARARRIVERRWSAGREELKEAAIAELPWLGLPKGAEALEELLEVAADVQRTERRRIDPATVKAQVPDRPLRLKRPKMNTPAPEERREMPVEEKKLKAVDLRSISAVERKRLEKLVAAQVEKDPRITPAALAPAVGAELGWELNHSQADYLLKKAKGPRGKEARPETAKEAKPQPPEEPAVEPAWPTAPPTDTWTGGSVCLPTAPPEPAKTRAVDAGEFGIIQREDLDGGLSRIFIDVRVPTEVAHVLFLRTYAEVHDLAAIVPHRRNGDSCG